MIIHHIKVNPIGTSCHNGINLFAQSSEVS